MIYLDNNATTPLAEEVIESINDCLVNFWANPSSAYAEGINANKLIQNSRQSIGRMINANTDQIVITSGGTEANNWIIMSSIKHFIECQKSDQKPHIISTNIEHDSIREPLNQLTVEDKSNDSLKTSIDVTFVSVDKRSGCVTSDDIIAAIRPQTCLISVMMANNETGVIQPIREIGLKLAKINTERVTNGLTEVLFHSDAAQAIGKIPVDVLDLNVHYLTIVGHKFYGPRIGALYRNHLKPLLPLFYGGGQERGLRPGTQNTPMIVGLAKASELVLKNIDKYNQHFNEIQTYFETKLKTEFEDLVSINCSDSPFGRLPNTTSLAFNDKRLIGSKLLALTPNLRASVGAACHSTNTKAGIPSPILIASGVSYESAQRTLRLSTGRDTTIEDIDKVVNELSTAVTEILSEPNGQSLRESHVSTNIEIKL